MWRFTKNPIYRRWGWQIFKNINRHCRIPTGGFSGIQDVTQVRGMLGPRGWLGHQTPSFLGTALLLTPEPPSPAPCLPKALGLQGLEPGHQTVIPIPLPRTLPLPFRSSLKTCFAVQ